MGIWWRYRTTNSLRETNKKYFVLFCIWVKREQQDHKAEIIERQNGNRDKSHPIALLFQGGEREGGGATKIKRTNRVDQNRTCRFVCVSVWLGYCVRMRVCLYCKKCLSTGKSHLSNCPPKSNKFMLDMASSMACFVAYSIKP